MTLATRWWARHSPGWQQARSSRPDRCAGSAQLAARRPDLRFAELRGNIATRLERAGEYGAIVVAFAALQRLGLEDRAAEVLDPEVMTPQVGQGALAVECRAEDGATRAIVARIDDDESHRHVRCERAFLAELGSGCDLPCGALAHRTGTSLEISGVVLAPNGGSEVRARSVGVDPERVGASLALRILRLGGRALLDRDGSA